MQPLSSRFRRLLMLVAALAVCGAGVRATQARLDRLKAQHELVNTHVAEKMTPRMALTVGALGAFRGLIADILFLRMEAEKQRGNYFELMQLGELIIQLQPDMPEAISFIGWNMAYNISVTFTAHEDRWRWVNRGIEVIRDEALKYSDDPDVYHQLAWIYQHKVGQILDDANRYYNGQADDPRARRPRRVRLAAIGGRARQRGRPAHDARPPAAGPRAAAA